MRAEFLLDYYDTVTKIMRLYSMKSQSNFKIMQNLNILLSYPETSSKCYDAKHFYYLTE